MNNIREQRPVKGALHGRYQTLQLSSPGLLSSKRDPCSLSTRGSGMEGWRGRRGHAGKRSSPEQRVPPPLSSLGSQLLQPTPLTCSELLRASRELRGRVRAVARRRAPAVTFPGRRGHSPAGSLAWAGEKGRSTGGTGDSPGGPWGRMLPVQPR